MAQNHLVIPSGRSAETTSFGTRFDLDTLPAALRVVAEPFAVCARAVIDALPDGVRLTRSLLSLQQARLEALRAAQEAGFVVMADGSRLLLEDGDRRAPGRMPREVLAEAGRPVLQSPAQALGYEPTPSTSPPVGSPGGMDREHRSPSAVDREFARERERLQAERDRLIAAGVDPAELAELPPAQATRLGALDAPFVGYPDVTPDAVPGGHRAADVDSLPKPAGHPDNPGRG